MNSFWLNFNKGRWSVWTQEKPLTGKAKSELRISESVVYLFAASRHNIIALWQQMSSEIKHFLLCELHVHCRLCWCSSLFWYTHHTLGSNEGSQGASPWGAGGTERQTDLLSSHQCSVHLYQHSLSLLCAFIFHHTEAAHRAAFILSKLQKGTSYLENYFGSYSLAKLFQAGRFFQIDERIQLREDLVRNLAEHSRVCFFYTLWTKCRV